MIVLKEIFKNKTKCTKTEYKKFIKEHNKQYGLREDISFIITLIFLLFFIFFTLFHKVFYLSILMFLVMVIYIYFSIIKANNDVKKDLNSKKIKNEYINTYIFYKLFFTISNKEKKSRFFYWEIRKVFENDTHFYIYITNKKAFLISKQGFVKGTSEEFEKFIKKRTFLKYKKSVE